MKKLFYLYIKGKFCQKRIFGGIEFAEKIISVIHKFSSAKKKMQIHVSSDQTVWHSYRRMFFIIHYMKENIMGKNEDMKKINNKKWILIFNRLSVDRKIF